MPSQNLAEMSFTNYLTVCQSSRVDDSINHHTLLAQASIHWMLSVVRGKTLFTTCPRLVYWSDWKEAGRWLPMHTLPMLDISKLRECHSELGSQGFLQEVEDWQELDKGRDSDSQAERRGDDVIYGGRKSHTTVQLRTEPCLFTGEEPEA